MKVNIVKKETVELREYWVIRGIRDKGVKKEVIAEYVMNTEPDPLTIAQFLTEHPSADFCSVAHDYALIK